MIAIEEAIKSNDIVVGLSLIFAALVGLIAYAYCNACRRSVKAAAAKAIQKAIHAEREQFNEKMRAFGVDRFIERYNTKTEIDRKNACITALKRENERLRKLIEATEGRTENGR